MTAIMESKRAASHEKVKAKILACRQPDLVIRAHTVTTGGGWVKVPINVAQTGSS